jgi:hypothetical protein
MNVDCARMITAMKCNVKNRSELPGHRIVQCQIEATDAAIDTLVYVFYGKILRTFISTL